MSKKDISSLREKLRRLYIQKEKRCSGIKQEQIQTRMNNIVKQIQDLEAQEVKE